MKQDDLKPNFELTLENTNEEVSYITLKLGASNTDPHTLELQDARNLAYALIQHVHLAEVKRSLKRAAAK